MVEAQTLHWIFSVPVGITICVFGLLGNAFSLVVWTRILRKGLGHSKSTGIYFLVLAVVDSGLLIFFLLTDSLPKINSFVLSTYAFCAFHSYVGFPLFFFFIVASIWLVVAATLNRFLAVKFPLKAKTLCSSSRAYAGICATLFCCFAINVPHFFNYRPAKGINGTYYIGHTEYSLRGSAIKYEFWVHCMFLVLAPWLSIAICNAGIIYLLFRRAKKASKMIQKSKSSEKASQEKQMTVVLLTVTFTFLILLGWQCVNQCFYMLGFGGYGTARWSMVDKSFAVAKLGVVINSSINFLLYCCAGNAFRKELLWLLKEGGSSFITFTSSQSLSTRPSTAKDSRLIRDSIETIPRDSVNA